MPVFSYSGKGRDGQPKKGEMEAPDEGELLSRLRLQGVNQVEFNLKGRLNYRKILKFIPMVGGSGVSVKDIMVFSRQFATMIDAGLPLVQCLDILGSQNDNPKFKKVLLAVKASVESGGQLCDGLRRFPDVFDDLYCNLVEAGEAGGILDSILQRLCTYIEKAAKLKAQLKSAMSYPIGVLCVAAIVVTVILYKVIPVFEKMFKDFGGTLPAPTQFVIDMSHTFANSLHLIILTLFGVVTAFRLFTGNPKGKLLWHKLLLKLPIFGLVLRRIAVARFTRTMGTLLGAGVPLLEAMEIVARTAGNMVIENGIMYTRAKVSEGKPMNEPLAETGIFPPMVVQMIAVGEQAGAVDVMLGKIADFYEEEVDEAVKALTGLMEPIMMVFLGGICGGILIAMYMPIFEMAGNIKS